MKTSLEVYDNQVKAEARVIDLQNNGASNPRLLKVERLAAYDLRVPPPEPPDWIRTKANADLFLVQYER